VDLFIKQKEEKCDAGETKKAARVYPAYLTIACVNNGMFCMSLDGVQLTNAGTFKMVLSG
jgi:hypothetical protein